MFKHSFRIRKGAEIPPPHQPSPALRQAQGTARLLRLPLKRGVIVPSNERVRSLADYFVTADCHEAALSLRGRPHAISRQAECELDIVVKLVYIVVK